MKKNALLMLENGTSFWGESVGADGYFVGEVIFNTSMTGYQEILTDPSYAKQILCFTYPHIGNVGINDCDFESSRIWLGGVIVKKISTFPSTLSQKLSEQFLHQSPYNRRSQVDPYCINTDPLAKPAVDDSRELSCEKFHQKLLRQCTSHWRARGDLVQFLKDQKILAISGIDTRKLTHLLRKNGHLAGCLMGGAPDPDFAWAQLQRAKPPILPQASSSFNERSTHHGKHLYTNNLKNRELDKEAPLNLSQASPALKAHLKSLSDTGGLKVSGCLTQSKTDSSGCLCIIVMDFGVKASIIEQLISLGCHVRLIPPETSIDELLTQKPDGILFSNGPGDPSTFTQVIPTIQALLQKEIPLCGICLGHQLLAIASGAQTVKMKNGHHGSNHPIQDLRTGKVFISAQNHDYAVEEKTLPSCLEITHRSLFDGTIAGLSRKDKPAFSFQGHPEGGPGPHELQFLFRQFVELIDAKKN